jgi:hypothetical protein
MLLQRKTGRPVMATVSWAPDTEPQRVVMVGAVRGSACVRSLRRRREERRARIPGK